MILVEEEHFDEFETELKTYHDIENVSQTCHLGVEMLSGQKKVTESLDSHSYCKRR